MDDLSFELVRSGRKTLALTVDREGQLTVRAPYRTPRDQIETFVLEKRAWIAKTRAHMAALPPKETLTLREGAALPYLGRTLTLARGTGTKPVLSGDTLRLPACATEAAPVVRWLEKQARLELTARISALSQRYGLRPEALRLSRAGGRWGSMSARGTLSLNRALILCPPDVIDYVIVHELCHLPHPDHSAAFWALVERCLPGYRAQRAWLRAHGSLTTFLPR